MSTAAKIGTAVGLLFLIVGVIILNVAIRTEKQPADSSQYYAEQRQIEESQIQEVKDARQEQIDRNREQRQIEREEQAQEVAIQREERQAQQQERQATRQATSQSDVSINTLQGVPLNGQQVTGYQGIIQDKIIQSGQSRLSSNVILNTLIIKINNQNVLMYVSSNVYDQFRVGDSVMVDYTVFTGGTGTQYYQIDRIQR